MKLFVFDGKSSYGLSCKECLILMLLLVEHFLNGSPVVPGGHVQVALWLLTVHMALGLHGLLVAHGFTQFLEMQASWVEHSSSEEQPANTGSATSKHF